MSDRLGEYRRKRSSDRTPEPAGDACDTGPDPMSQRFVVQEHHATRLHWDLRLEHDGVAVSWAIPNGIPDDPGENRLAVHTEDHPLEYLAFEGEIPKGQYGAGTMTIWDHGTYEVHEFTDAKVEVTFHGERLRGRYGLFPLERRKGEKPGKDWMIHRMDPPEDPDREPMPERLSPMLARPAELPADAGAWAYEVKWDGVRALVYSAPGRLRLESRNGNDVTAGYPELQALNRALSMHRAVLDGEIVAFDADGRPSFERLQRRMHVRGQSAVRRLAKETPVVLMLFDVLWLDGHATTGRTYDERRELLEGLGPQGAAWRVPDALAGTAAQVLEATRAAGLEGVVAKRRDSAYEPGRRSACWVKARNMRRIEVVVGGYTPGEGRRTDRIGALLVGVEDDGQLRYAGRVGSGFSDAELDRLRRVLEAREDSPFSGRQPERRARPTFVEPTRLAEVQFSEWTQDGLLRQPSYLGLREEPAPAAFLDAATPVKGGRSVRVGERTLKLTNLDKVLYPAAGFAKRDVISYLAHVAPVLLPHLRDRPLTRKRYPDGVEGEAFFEKQCPSHRPDWVRTAAMPVSGKTVDFCVADDEATLVWLGNLAALELHASLSRVGAPEVPAAMVFDLDPGPPATIVECCRVAVLLQGMLEGLGLECHAKTSGSKGLQVYLPLNQPDVTYSETKSFSRAVAELLAAGEPDLVVAQMRKDIRKGKVYVDWAQNEAFKTTVAVYSLRAREHPTVSTPVTWDEVRECRDAEDPELLRFEAAQVLDRVAEHGDLFAAVESSVQRLPTLG